MAWCPICEEPCSNQPDNMCSTCGEALVASPPPADGAAAANGTSSSESSPFVPAQAQHEGMEGMDALHGIPAGQIMSFLTNNGTGNTNMTNMGNLGNLGAATDLSSLSDLAAILPPEALNPQSAQPHQRPTAQKVLDGLKRVVLTERSVELWEGRVDLWDVGDLRTMNEMNSSYNASSSSPCLSFSAVPGEFGPLVQNPSSENAANTANAASSNKKSNATNSSTSLPHQSRQSLPALLVISPLTTKGGLSALSPATKSQIDKFRQHRIPFVAYVERGEGVTFVQKALVCQQAGMVGMAGTLQSSQTSQSSQQSQSSQHSQPSQPSQRSLCVGVIVGNSGTKEVWPYVMQDTKKEAETYGLSIPVVMVKKADGKKLLHHWQQTFGTNGANSATTMNTATSYIPCQITLHPKDTSTNSTICTICTEAYQPGQTILKLPHCHHMFHESCALAWLKGHNTCPYCRREMGTEDEEYNLEMGRRRRERERNGRGGGNGGNGGSGGGEHTFYG